MNDDIRAFAPQLKQACSRSGSYCGEGFTVETKCPAGYVCSDPSRMQECQSGSLCEEGTSAEILCPAGFVCPTAKSKELCPSGAFCVSGSVKPTACPPGTFCINGSSAAAMCPAGSFCVAGSSAATVCPFQSTSVAGAKSQDECVCDAGYLRSTDATCEEIKNPEGGLSVDLIIGAAVLGGASLAAALGVGAWFYWGKAGNNVVIASNTPRVIISGSDVVIVP